MTTFLIPVSVPRSGCSKFVPRNCKNCVIDTSVMLSLSSEIATSSKVMSPSSYSTLSVFTKGRERRYFELNLDFQEY